MEKRIILIGSFTFILIVLILVLIKPTFVLKVDKDFKHKIDWFKTIFLGIIITILVSICIFLYFPNEDIIEYNNFSFGISY